MVKGYYFLWRREGMSRAEFIRYYEDIHAPLIIANLPRARDFRRNFPVWHRQPLPATPFDVLTGITYESAEQFEAAMQAYHSPPFLDVVTEDELRFINRARVRFAIVDEIIDGAEAGAWRPAPTARESVKLLRLRRRPPGVEPHAFRERFEAHEVPKVRALIPGCMDYRRNYIRAADPTYFVTPELAAEIEQHPIFGCDLVEEFFFHDEGAAGVAAALDGDIGSADQAGPMLRTSMIACEQYMTGLHQPAPVTA